MAAETKRARQGVSPARAPRKAAAKRAAAKPAAKPKKPTQAVVRRKAAASKTRVANRAAKQAKAAGAVGDTRGRGKLSHQQRALRDSAILARLNAGASTKDVAAEFEVTQRTVQRAQAEFESMPSVLNLSPSDVLVEMGRSYRRLIGDFEAMAFVHSTSNPSVALGAKKAAAESMRAYVVMLAEVGLLPENLELFRAESVLRGLADKMVETMELVSAGELSAEEAAVVFRSMTGVGEQPRLKAVA